MADRYFYSQDETPFGPFSATELRKLAASGRIRPTDPVWKEGHRQSVPAARVRNLFASPPEPQAATPAREGAPPDPVPAEEPAVRAKGPEAATTPLAGTTAGVAGGKAPARPAYEAARGATEPQARPKRVVGNKGAVLTGQDGVRVHFRKKCEKCGHEDSCRST